MKKLILLLSFAITTLSCEYKQQATNAPQNDIETKQENEQDTDHVNINKEEKSSQDNEDLAYKLQYNLPEWIFNSKIISKNTILEDYQIDSRLNPFYLEEDFNGDGNLDIALPIKHIKSGKVGFVIIHNKTNAINIIGAGKLVKNGLSDDLSYIDIWKINRKRKHLGTDIDENGELIETQPLLLDYPSIDIMKTETGGGLIFWNGEEYEYLHQTC
jgi:actin-related protein